VSFKRKNAPERTARHHALKHLIAHSFLTKEISEIYRIDGKLPSVMKSVPWDGKCT